MPEVAGIRRFGAAALDLAWVAAGRFDGFWERGLSPWDMAAGILLIREAGGYVTDLDGGEAMLETGDIVAGNEAIHRPASRTPPRLTVAFRFHLPPETRYKFLRRGAPCAEGSMARDFDPYMLSSPRIFMVRMIIFLIIAAFVPLVLYREVAKAFMANPGLNGLIVGVLVIGIAMAMRNVVGLIPEVRWVNSFRRRETNLEQTPPRLIAPMATLLRDRADSVRALHLDLALDPRFDRDAPRREPRHPALPRRAARLPRPARHVLGPRHHGQLGRRHHPVALASARATPA